jgi:LCP family protein required for cell wall assembly
MNPSKRKGWWVLGVALLAAVIALLAFIIYPEAKRRWITPLGPRLGLPGSTQALSAADATAASNALAGSNAAGVGNAAQLPAADAFSATIQPAETPQPVCGGPPSMNILAVGSDSRSDYLYGLADVIRIVRVDFVTPRVDVFSLPRDLWVEIPGIEENFGITHGKLNQAFFYGTPGMGYYKGPGGGAGLLARTLDLNFGLHIDNYGVVNLENFVKIVDAVGGIDVHLPEDVDGRPTEDFPFDLGYYQAGEHHLNGVQALNLARIRQKYNDFVRIDNQNQVICGLKDKITTPAVLPKIPQLITALRDSVLTDLTPQQLTQLACLAPKLKPENLQFSELPEEILSSGRIFSQQLNDETYVVEADPQAIEDYAGQFMEGSLPAGADETFCPSG